MLNAAQMRMKECEDADSLVAGQFSYLSSFASVRNLPDNLQGNGYIYCEGASTGWRVEYLVCTPGMPIYVRMYIFNSWTSWSKL